MFRITFFLWLVSVCAIAQNRSDKSISVVAFGSCSHEDDSVQMWDDVIAQKPDLWIWMGDNIYGDTHDMVEMKRKYDVQKARTDYQRLLKATPVVGTWDDHDYGTNDGGKFFIRKEESKTLALNFLDVPQDAPVRKHAGIYDSYEYGTKGKKVKVILLDTRFFRDTVIYSKIEGRRYDPNPNGDVLGEEQWKWLEKELKNDADVNIIVSSIQFLANEHYYEKWGNFPTARQRLIDLLAKTKPKRAMFVSGDRHIAEVSRTNVKGLPYALYDVTASGLTHTWDTPREESNTMREGKLIIRKNFGVLKIDWTSEEPKVTIEIRGADNQLWQSSVAKF